MTYSYYPEVHSSARPFYIEIKTEGEVREIRLFKAQYLDYASINGDSSFSEVHPWNMALNGYLAQQKNVISFWTLKFVRFMVDALNDKYEAQMQAAAKKNTLNEDWIENFKLE